MKTPMTIGQLSEYSSLGVSPLRHDDQAGDRRARTNFSPPPRAQAAGNRRHRDADAEVSTVQWQRAPPPYVASLARGTAMQGEPEAEPSTKSKTCCGPARPTTKFTGPLPNTAWGTISANSTLDAAAAVFIRKAATATERPPRQVAVRPVAADAKRRLSRILRACGACVPERERPTARRHGHDLTAKLRVSIQLHAACTVSTAGARRITLASATVVP